MSEVAKTEQKKENTKTEKPVEKKQERAPHEYKMIKVVKLGDENSDKLREHIRSNINMIVKDEDCYVFNASAYVQRIIKEQFPEAQVEIVPSDEELYHNSYKVQSSMKLKTFKRINESLKDDDTILVIIKSHPREANEDKADEFAQYVAKNCYTQDEKSKLLFIIRRWLRDQFQVLKNEKKLQDKNGKELEGANVIIGRYNFPLEKPMDKAIKVKLYVKLGEAQAIIDVMNKRELTSTIDFINTQIRREKRRAKTEKKQQKRFADKKSKATEEKKAKDADVEKKNKKNDRFKGRKSAPADKKEEGEPKAKRPQQKSSRKEEPVEEICIEIDDKEKRPKYSAIIIDCKAQEGTAGKLENALKEKLNFVKFMVMQKGDLKLSFDAD